MTDFVRPLKLENPQDGGTEIDIWPTELDPTEDSIMTYGIGLVGSDVFIGRNGGDMVFTDVNNNTPVTLTELLGGSGSSDYNLDGGFANSIFLSSQNINGGGA